MYNNRQLNKYRNQIDINKSNAVGYKRVSDIRQIDGASLDTQDVEIRKFCQENNLNLLNIYVDEGKSGLTTHRSGFMSLIENIKPGNFVIVYELSRFARDQTDILNNFKDLVTNKGCTFICISPRIDSRDPSSSLMLGIYSTLAQEESNRISSRVKTNMQRLSKEGRLVCRPPFGYIHSPDTRLYVADDEQQAVVEKLRVMNLCGVSQAEMARRLNNEGFGYVLNNNKTTKIENPQFSRSTINSILQGYGFIKNEKSPKFTYPQRIDGWNQMVSGKTTNNNSS